MQSINKVVRFNTGHKQERKRERDRERERETERERQRQRQRDRQTDRQTDREKELSSITKSDQTGAEFKQSGWCVKPQGARVFCKTLNGGFQDPPTSPCHSRLPSIHISICTVDLRYHRPLLLLFVLWTLGTTTPPFKILKAIDHCHYYLYSGP